MAESHIETRVLRVDPAAPDPAIIRQAAELLGRGRLVAFPTETVYGLGANALDAVAVERIFKAKGRPGNNPIIVHVANVHAARQIAAEWPAKAQHLTDAFWPGPLTIVLKKAACVPDIVTSRQQTVAIRMPAHLVAAALLEASGLPIAAPSANRSSQISPTRAEHVLRSLGGRIDMVLDAGPTLVGIESTVVDMTREQPMILRPGSISRERIESALDERIEVFAGAIAGHSPVLSPGMLARHYAPQALVEQVECDILLRARQLSDDGRRVGLLAFAPTLQLAEPTAKAAITLLAMPIDPAAYASRLYAALHELDDSGVGVILIERPPQGVEWQAVNDRLRRMTH